MSEHPAMPQKAARPQSQYLVSGDARQEVNLIGLRDRIRNGTLQPADEIAVVGTDLWKPASEYPELSRYFALVQRSPQATTAAAAQAPPAPMASRILPGIAYPFTSPSSVGVIVVASIAALVVPLLSIPAALCGTVYALGVIRKSSDGKTTPPSLAEVGGPLDWIIGGLQVIAITLISAWPFVLVAMLAAMGLVRSWILLGLAPIIMMLYYPASLATVAVWKSVKIALSIQQIFRFIGILGAQYYAVIGMWIVAFIAVGVGSGVMRVALAGQARLLALIDVAATMWVSFYASHLLGWAIHIHRDQL